MRALVFFFLLAGSNVFSQNLFDKTWSSELLMQVTDIATDAQGFSYFTLAGSNAQVDSSVAVLVKTNADFEIIWSKRYKTYSRDDLASVEILEDGNLLLGGTMRQSFALNLGAGLIKVDPDGNVLWRRVIDDNFDRRIIFTSERIKNDIIAINRYGVTGQADAIIKVNSDGDFVSAFDLFEGDTGVSFENVMEFDNETFIGTGRIFDDSVQRNVVFVALFEEDEPIWFKKYDFGETAIGTSLDINANNQIAVAANILNPESVFNGQNSIVFRINSDGSYLGGIQVFIENDGFNKFSGGLKIEDSGEIMAAFSFQTDVGPIPVAAKFDNEDDLLWVTVPETGLEYSHAFRTSLGDARYFYTGSNLSGDILINTRDASDGAVGCGEIPSFFDFEPINAEVLTSELLFVPAEYEALILPIEVSDFAFIEGVLCDINVNTSEEEHPPSVRVYPVPASDIINFDSLDKIHKIEIISTDGRRILSLNEPLKMKKIDIQDLQSGVYHLLFYTESGVTGARFIKM